MNPAIEAVQLTKTFPSGDAERHALRNVDLHVEQGEFVAVMGPSGCGKSTLLYLLGALLRPTSGEVRLDGQSLAGMNDDALSELRGRRVGFVFQAFNLVPLLTAAENVALPASLAGERASKYASRVDELLDAVGLGAQRDQLPAHLSGGEQQRVAVARALVMRPAVVLADEPTGSLDSTSGAAVMDLLLRLNAGGQTIVLVTHDVKVAALAQRVITLRDGAVIREDRVAASGVIPSEMT